MGSYKVNDSVMLYVNGILQNEARDGDYVIENGLIILNYLTVTESDVITKVTHTKEGILKETFHGDLFNERQLESLVKNYAKYRRIYGAKNLRKIIIKYGSNNLKIIYTLSSIKLLNKPKCVKRKKAKTH